MDRTSKVSNKTSVIIPNYNHARYLSQRIESVLRQTLQEVEIIILDDCSTDDSRVIIEKYAAQDDRIRFFFNETNSGSTFKQWNKGISVATGEYIWLAESDDYADPTLLATLTSALDGDERIGLAYCDSNIVDEDNNFLNIFEGFYSFLDPNLWKQDFTIDGIDLIRKFLPYRNIIPNASAVVFRKSIVEKSGKADESFKINGDWIFWVSIIANHKVFFSSKKLNYFRHHLNNVRSKTILNGVALYERTRVLRVIQSYKDINHHFLNLMLEQLFAEWFQGIVSNSIPLRTHVAIYKNLKLADTVFLQRIARYFKNYMLINKLSGIRQFIGDGFLYRIIKK